MARLGLAAVLGATLGAEREARNRTAGLATHALVALGAALFTIAGAYGFGDVHHGPNVDPARVAAQVATGIGFIGGGAILKLGASVRGLTTAATLWLAAALGMAAGAGALAAAVICAGVVLVVLVGVRMAVRPLLRRLGPPTHLVQVEYERGHGTLGPLLKELEAVDGTLGAVRVEDRDDVAGGLRRATVEVHSRDPAELERVVRAVRARREVQSAARQDPGPHD